MCDYLRKTILQARWQAVADVWTTTSFGVSFKWADKTTSLPKARTEEKHVYDGNDDNDDDDDDDDDENLDEVGDESKVFTDGLVLGLQTH